MKYAVSISYSYQKCSEYFLLTIIFVISIVSQLVLFEILGLWQVFFQKQILGYKWWRWLFLPKKQKYSLQKFVINLVYYAMTCILCGILIYFTSIHQSNSNMFLFGRTPRPFTGNYKSTWYVQIFIFCFFQSILISSDCYGFIVITYSRGQL